MEDEFTSAAGSEITVLEVRRTIYAPVRQVFEAWTQPVHLKRWWGPRPVICIHAEIDLRVNGNYRIANQFPDGSVVWILGKFEVVEPPRKLVYTWRTNPEPALLERVTVQFNASGDATDVVVRHERIPDAATRDKHEHGWEGCLDELASYMNREATLLELR
jgi:uncharacterized protein YndB with AHSA1/START domain